MATIVEFALKEEPLDVEKMRKCLLKQVIVKQIISAAFGSLRSIKIKSNFLHGGKEKSLTHVAFLVAAGEG